MLKECDNYPNLNHASCELDQYEVAIANFFESHGLAVERLCSRWLPKTGLSPDFKVSKDDGSRFLCEVKHVESSTAALPEADWRYNNAKEYEQLIEASRKEGIPSIALPDQIALWRQEVPYPEEGRNTKLHEQEYEKTIREALQNLPIANQPLSVHRYDPYIWRDEEIEEFINSLSKELDLIVAGQTPHDWFCDFGVYRGNYRRTRDHGRFLHNSIEVRREGSHIVVNSISYLGINWQKISDACHEAQKQIIYSLQGEHETKNVPRVVVLFLEEDLIFEYFGHLEELKNEIRRHIQKKSPDLSTVVFYCDPILSDSAKFRFLVFHVACDNIPKLDQDVFDNRVSDQIDL